MLQNHTSITLFTLCEHEFLMNIYTKFDIRCPKPEIWRDFVLLVQVFIFGMVGSIANV